MDHIAIQPDDAQILDVLTSQGDTDLNAPRHTLMYFYPTKKFFGRKASLQPVADALATKGWAITTLSGKVLVAEAQQAADEVTVARRTAWAEDLAAQFDVDFDGWECAVYQANAA